MSRLAENCSVSSSNYATIALSRGVSGSRDLSTAVPKLKRDTPQKHLHNAGRNHFQGVTTTSQAALTILKDGVRRFGPSAGSEHMLRAEVAAAEDAIRTGLYSVWRNEHLIGKTKNGKLFRTNNGVEITDYHECFRIGPSSRCFCGHPYRAHPLPIVKAAQSDGEPGTRPAPPRFPPPCSECRCSEYRFIPDHPDAIAEPWLSRRAGFDVTAWAAKCKCKHTHLTHDANPPHRCRERGCGCSCYASTWECLVCDGKWQDHMTIVESTAERCWLGKRCCAVYYQAMKLHGACVPLADPAVEKAATEGTKFMARAFMLYALQLVARRALGPSLSPMPEQIDKALRRGVPLRSLDVSGDLRPPAYEFNPMLVLQFANLLDSVISSPTAAPSREDRTAFLRLLSEAAGCDNGASILAVAKKYKELADSLLDAVHPVLLSMYRRKLDSYRGGPHKDSQHRLALAIEGGAMRGCVTAGMAVALHHMGYADTFDAVFGSSAGSLIGAYFISRQLPYEGTQIYYDWLPFMGKKFLDLKRIGRGLGLGFLLDGDIIDFLINKLGKPLLNLDVLLKDIVQEKQPLDWDKFKANDSWQPLKVVTSGLCSQRAIVLDSKHGNIRDLPSLMACVRASMLLPGLAGPVVHLPIYPESTNLTPHYLPLITPSALPRFAPQAPCGFVSEPLADALLYEPVPFRSAIADGYDQVLVLRSRPDGKRVGRLGGIEAAVENRLARRFFAGKHKLRHVYEYMKQRQHRIRYMKDMLMLNEATNRHIKLQVAGLDGVEKEGHAFAVALDPSTAEIARISMTRKHILEGVRAGFARLYDVIVPDPQKRGRGYEEALKVFPTNLPGVTEAFTSSTSSVSSFPLVPPLFDDSSEVTTDPKELEDYVIRAAARERERRNLLANDANS
ncbi:phospholipase, patatin family protein [Toxoplasma gondii]|uniref:Phospholipase, patatin family protein n=1 Tax=Toxoplasma gondii TaxID=5811 RepID=A0A7J6K5A1_TOXGO|nr:phospholipase, patatin family protein [Toxoplasma gondii]